MTSSDVGSITAGAAGSRWMVIVAWQVLAMLVSGTGAFSQLLAEKGVNIPTTQSFLNYLLLSLHFFMLGRRRRRRPRPPSASGGSISPAPPPSSSSSSSPPVVVVVVAPHVTATYQRILPDGTAMSDNNNNSGGSNDESGGDDDNDDDASQHHSCLRMVPLRYAWWKYALLAIADVEGNFFLVLAYQYTTIASVQLLDCFTIPVVMVLSVLAFSTKYTRRHIAGGALCSVGLVLLVVSDVVTDRYGAETANRRVLGDVLVLVGCVFYGCSNVGQEWMVKRGDGNDRVHSRPPSVARSEYLAMIGGLGACVSALQMVVLERDRIRAVDWHDTAVIMYMLGFSTCLVSLYMATPLLLQHSSAVLMNLSFLTADFWSILLAIYIFYAHLHPLYFVAFFVIITGIVLFNYEPPPPSAAVAEMMTVDDATTTTMMMMID